MALSTRFDVSVVSCKGHGRCRQAVESCPASWNRTGSWQTVALPDNRVRSGAVCYVARIERRIEFHGILGVIFLKVAFFKLVHEGRMT